MTHIFSSNEVKLNIYREFIKRCTNSPGSVSNYSEFKRLEELIRNRIEDFTCLLDYDDPAYVQGIYDMLSSVSSFEEFSDNRANQGRNFIQIGGGQYHNALKTYIAFLKASLVFHDKAIALPQHRHTSNLPLQQIFYGAPGTGKSHAIKKHVDDQGKISFRTTFHPDSDYSTFVGCYKPTVRGDGLKNQIISFDLLSKKLNDYLTDGKTYPIHRFAFDFWQILEGYTKAETEKLLTNCSQPISMYQEVLKARSLGKERRNYKESTITYSFVPQAFTKAYIAAWKTEEDVFLIIEEINRGNCAQIFGDLFQLLDRTNGFSQYPIDTDDDLKNYLSEFLADSTRNDIPDNVKDGTKLLLPPNLYIWATMNTSDQSLFPVDSAFKRRWDWRYVPITQAYKKDQNDNYETDSDGQKIPLGWKIRLKIKDQEKDYDWWEFVQAINRIVYDMTSSADKQLGYFFCQAGDDGIISADKFVNKVVFYLWNDVFKDYGFDDYASIFKFKTIVDEKEVTKDLTFPDFFDPDADTVNNDVAMQFVDNVLAWSSSDDKKNDNG